MATIVAFAVANLLGVIAVWSIFRDNMRVVAATVLTFATCLLAISIIVWFTSDGYEPVGTQALVWLFFGIANLAIAWLAAFASAGQHANTVAEARRQQHP